MHSIQSRQTHKQALNNKDLYLMSLAKPDTHYYVLVLDKQALNTMFFEVQPTKQAFKFPFR